MESGNTPAHSKCDLLRDSYDPEAALQVNNSRNDEKEIWYSFQPDSAIPFSCPIEPNRCTGSESKNSTETKESGLRRQNTSPRVADNDRQSLQINYFPQSPTQQSFTQTFKNIDTLKSINFSSQNLVDEQRNAYINDLIMKNNHLNTQLRRVNNEHETLVLKYKQALGEIEHLNKQLYSLKTTAASSRQDIPSEKLLERKSVEARPPSQFRIPQQFIPVVQKPIAYGRVLSPVAMATPSIPSSFAHRPLSPSNMPLLLSKLQNLEIQRQHQRQQIALLRSQLTSNSEPMPFILRPDQQEKIEYIQKQINTVATSSRRIAEQLRSPARSPPKTMESVERFRKLERYKALYESENQQLKMKLMLKDRKIQQLQQRTLRVKTERSPPMTNRGYYL